jgi:prepilin-type N-terminal cleavage/methylation domain-containing protein
MLNVRLPKHHKPGIGRDEKGFTLLEVLIAVALTAIIVAGIYMAMSTSTKVLVDTTTQETAKDMAASAMEWIKSQPYNAVSYTLPAAMRTNGGLTVFPTTGVIPVNEFRFNEEQIDIIVKSGTKTVFTLTDYRVNY